MRATVIGAGLAGCEAAMALARGGVEVTLYEQKPLHFSPAHKYPGFAELVCSNSLKSDSKDTAGGLLKAELRLLGSVVLESAAGCAVAAGGALAVDRYAFSDAVTAAVRNCEKIEIVSAERTEIGEGPVIVATGPLTEGALCADIQRRCGSNYLSFYDAAAPIISAESLDMSQVFAASRWQKDGDGDYLNCYMDKPQYERFCAGLTAAQTATGGEYDVYEGCMPVEKLARRGADSLRYGPMRPVGLTDPRTGHRPWAAVQLRREDAGGTMYNLVGFQTNLRFGEQKRVFGMIPGLENAEFVRYGVMHRNTFLNSPAVLQPTLNLKNDADVFFAGQITGFEGYVESAACGALAARFLLRRLRGETAVIPPEQTMCGALLRYITAANSDFQPMGANMGLLPALDERIKAKKERYAALYARGVKSMEEYLHENSD